MMSFSKHRPKQYLLKKWILELVIGCQDFGASSIFSFKTHKLKCTFANVISRLGVAWTKIFLQKEGLDNLAHNYLAEFCVAFDILLCVACVAFDKILCSQKLPAAFDLLFVCF